MRHEKPETRNLSPSCSTMTKDLMLVEFEQHGDICILRLHGKFATGQDSAYLRSKTDELKNAIRPTVFAALREDCESDPYVQRVRKVDLRFKKNPGFLSVNSQYYWTSEDYWANETAGARRGPATALRGGPTEGVAKGAKRAVTRRPTSSVRPARIGIAGRLRPRNGATCQSRTSWVVSARERPALKAALSIVSCGRKLGSGILMTTSL